MIQTQSKNNLKHTYAHKNTFKFIQTPKTQKDTLLNTLKTHLKHTLKTHLNTLTNTLTTHLKHIQAHTNTQNT